MPEPVFEWYKDKAGKFRFRLKAANGEIIATSEGYNSKDGCVGSIESVKKNAPVSKVVEAKQYTPAVYNQYFFFYYDTAIEQNLVYLF